VSRRDRFSVPLDELLKIIAAKENAAPDPDPSQFSALADSD
jgi:hypothetical protein